MASDLIQRRPWRQCAVLLALPLIGCAVRPITPQPRGLGLDAGLGTTFDARPVRAAVPDEPRDAGNPCGAHGTYKVAGDAGECQCKIGFSGRQCWDDNECATRNGGCGLFATCTNTEGGYKCGPCAAQAQPPFVGCGDFNACDIDPRPCQPGQCSKAALSFRCSCPDGYIGTGSTSCTDLDECAGSSYVCGAGTCTNVIGSYQCQCPSGYTGTGTSTCVDVDECAASSNPCGLDTCLNTIGSYVCVCGSDADAGSADAGSAACVTGQDPVPAAPTVDGEPSAGHEDVTWRWRAEPLASTFELVIDAQPAIALPASMTGLTRVLSLGKHRLRIRSCNRAGRCSAYTSIVTTVERFGDQYPHAFRDVKRALPRTAIGHVLALNCHNCYENEGQVILDDDAANAKISRAVHNGADYVELDVADVDGKLYATHDDPTTPGTRPLIETLLDNPSLASSQTMLIFELKEKNMDPAQFATELLDLLESHRNYVANGRPLLIKAYNTNRAYLAALRDAARQHPFLAPYLRFWVLFGSFTDIAAWEALIQSEVMAEHFEGVEVDYRSNNLFGLLSYAKALGLSVGVFSVPGPEFGEVLLSSMREEVSLITTDYRVDQARAIVQAPNSLAYLNSDDVFEDSLLQVSANAGVSTQTAYTLGQVATGTSFGSPTVERFSNGQPFYGPILSFASTKHQAIQLSNVDAAANAGFLVTALVQFADLTSLPPGSTQTLLSSGQPGGFVLDLYQPKGGAAVLRFGVHVNGKYVYHAYPIAGGSANGCVAKNTEMFVEALSAQRAYAITGAYDGSGNVHLFIDHKCAGSTPGAASGQVTAGASTGMVGASSMPTPPFAASYFSGHVRQAQVQRWTTHAGGDIN